MPTLDEQIATLRECAPQLTGRSLEFANSLLAWHGRRGLTAAQARWVPQLIERAQNPAAERPTVEVGSLQPVVELLERAKRHLRHPAILMLANGMTLRLSIAGPRSRNAGSVNVAGTGSFAERDWYGLVKPDGTFEPCRRYDAPTQQAVAQALRELAADPAAAAARYGHLTGVCCFCNQALTDERSTAVGYGSTCAGHYGLPWGVRAAAAARAEREAAPNPNATNRERLAQAVRPAVRQGRRNARRQYNATVTQLLTTGRISPAAAPDFDRIDQDSADGEAPGWW